MKTGFRSLFSVVLGLAVAGLTAIILMPVRQNGKRNGIVEKLNKVKTSIVKNRAEKSDNYKDIPDCFI
jgi:hypothetical protein